MSLKLHCHTVRKISPENRAVDFSVNSKSVLLPIFKAKKLQTSKYIIILLTQNRTKKTAQLF